MIALDIHVENLKEKDFENGNKKRIIEEILEHNVPVALSFSPWQEPIWGEQNLELFELFKKAVKRENSVLGQQGLNHKCCYGHETADPWHENYCLYRKSLSYEQQNEFMKKGKNRLEELFEKEVDLYTPPNHQFDDTTLKVAADLRYKFFADKAMISLQPYRAGNMLVIPERDLESGRFDCDAVYIHYDEIDKAKENYKRAIESAVSLRELEPEDVSELTKKVNRVLKHSYKYLRDFRRAGRKLAGKGRFL